MRKTILSFPEVETVISQHGRPQDGTDATGFFNAEFFAPLKPPSQWPARIYKDDIIERINDELRVQFPGVSFNFSQYIEDNVEEAASGVKGENSVKLFGPDLGTLEQLATKIRAAMWEVKGIVDLAIFDSLGQVTLDIDIDRDRAARYGLAVGDIAPMIQAGIGGQQAGTLFEPGGDRNFPIVVRLAPEYRGSVDAIRNLALNVGNPGGTGSIQIPLSEVARVSLRSGPSMIYRENEERYVPIKFGVRKRDLAGAVREAQRKVAAEVALPPGYRIEWVGTFGDLAAALERLKVVVPLSIGAILLLLLAYFRSLIDMALAAAAMPLALIGGVFALAITGTPFSVSAAIGFIGLFGISVMEGIIILSYFNRRVEIRAWQRRRSRRCGQGASSPRHDDLHRGLRGAPSRCLFLWRRRPGPTASRDRGRRWKPPLANPDSGRTPRSDRRIFASAPKVRARGSRGKRVTNERA